MTSWIFSVALFFKLYTIINPKAHEITPLEIRQKQFERTLRGYDKDEVSAFLLSLSQEWERMQDEAKEMRIKLEATEREVVKLREVESSLYKTLKTAEDTGSNMIEQANKAAELHLKETQFKGEQMLNEVKAKAKDTMELAEDTAKQMLGGNGRTTQGHGAAV